MGHAGVDGSAGGFGGGGFGGSSFSDIFGDAFGDIFQALAVEVVAARSVARIYATMDLTLEEAVRGVEKKIRIPTLVACSTCDGSGQTWQPPKTCNTCHGAGQIRMQQGFFAVQQTCPSCRGRPDHRITLRQLSWSWCKEETKTLSVKIPAGVDTGDRVRLTGEGEAGSMGGPAGDLYVQVQVKEHHIFQREGAHLHCVVPISIVDAVLGGELEVPTLDGRVKLKIPPETQSGKMFRLRGKGVTPVRGGGAGDLICQSAGRNPVNLTAEQKSC